MPTTVTVRPAPGARVRMPGRAYDLLPEEGAKVPRDAFWLRRLADGDVVEVPPPAASAPKTSASAPASKTAKEG